MKMMVCLNGARKWKIVEYFIDGNRWSRIKYESYVRLDFALPNNLIIGRSGRKKESVNHGANESFKSIGSALEVATKGIHYLIGVFLFALDLS